jgi:hypothetical protein
LSTSVVSNFLGFDILGFDIIEKSGIFDVAVYLDAPSRVVDCFTTGSSLFSIGHPIDLDGGVFQEPGLRYRRSE